MSITTIYLKKFENNFFKTKDNKSYSSIYSEDVISYYFPFAEKIKNDLKNKSYFKSGHEVINSYLHPRIIFSFNYIFNNNENIINNSTIKLQNDYIFIYLQIVIYFFSIYFFFNACSKFIINNQLNLCFLSFCLLNPIVMQWHLQLGTESIYFSLLIILTTLILNTQKTFVFILIGMLIGILYLQRSVTILYFAIIIFYLIIQKKKIIYSILGFAIIIFFLGMHNYARSGVFYFTSTQTKTDFFTYLEIPIIQRSHSISREMAQNLIEKQHKNFSKQNDLNLTLEKDRIKMFRFIQINSFKNFLNNKYETIKLVVSNYFHALLLNPAQVYFSTKYINYENYKLSNDHKNWVNYRIFISIIYYFLCALGIVYSFKFIPLSINILFFSSAIYFFLIGCWLGNSRYFAPSWIFLNLYLSVGLLLFVKYINKIIVYLVNINSNK